MLRDRIKECLKSIPSNYDFPVGGRNILLSKNEIELIDKIQSESHPIGLSEVHFDISIRDAYSLVIFAVRTAVYAVRSNNENMLKAGLIGLCIDLKQVDWRDLLGALAIIEDCARRIGVNLQSELSKLDYLIEDRRVKETISAYFNRSNENRKIEVFGFRAVGTDTDLNFEPRGY